MKKNLLLSIAGVLILALLLSGCSGKAHEISMVENGGVQNKIVKIGATPVPHSEILEFAKPLLAEKNIKLEIIEFTDYVTPNLALNDKEIDANFFQHLPYMMTFANNNNIKLSSIGKIHVEPLGLYSKDLKSIEEVKKGAKIAIPNDPTNGGRALLLLEKHGLITLRRENPSDILLEATKNDIVENPKNLNIVELEAPQLPRSLDDVAAAIINTNYALEAGLNPIKDAIVIEDEDSPYANIIAVRPEDEKNETLLEVIKILNSEEMKKFIEDNYKGSIVPAF